MPGTFRSSSDLHCTGHKLRRAVRRTTQLYDEALAPTNLTITQFSLLARLEKDGESRLSDLADQIGMDRTSLSRTIRPLMARGLVIARLGQHDRRAKVVCLSKAGHKLFAEAVPLWRRAERRMAQILSSEGQVALHGFLEEIAASEKMALEAA